MLLTTCGNIRMRIDDSWLVINVVKLLRWTNSVDRKLYEAALGLAYLHQHGVVHGDIKAVSITILFY